MDSRRCQSAPWSPSRMDRRGLGSEDIGKKAPITGHQHTETEWVDEFGTSGHREPKAACLGGPRFSHEITFPDGWRRKAGQVGAIHHESFDTFLVGFRDGL